MHEKFISENQPKKMKKINEWFDCLGCWAVIMPAEQTCRNHCPECFMSLHVDWETPWDRIWDCQWIMIPERYERANWIIKIHFVCTDCWKEHNNKAASDDEIWNLDAQIEFRKEKYDPIT